MGKYPHGLSNKYVELIKQLRAPPGTDLTRLPYPLMLKDKVKDGRSDYRPESCMAELNLVFQCWTTHDFDQSKCTKEAASLMACFEKSMKDAERAKLEAQGFIKEGITTIGKHTKLSSQQVNALLKKNPHAFPNDGKKYRKT